MPLVQLFFHFNDICLKKLDKNKWTKTAVGIVKCWADLKVFSGSRTALDDYMSSFQGPLLKAFLSFSLPF